MSKNFVEFKNKDKSQTIYIRKDKINTISIKKLDLQSVVDIHTDQYSYNFGFDLYEDAFATYQHITSQIDV